MTRYRHYLQPTVKHTFPHTILCVDCVSRSDVVQQTARKQVEELVTWHVTNLVRAENRYQVVSCVTGRSQQSWWQYLSEIVSSGVSVWCVSNRCVRSWSLLGLWEELEANRWTLEGEDERTKEDRDTAVRRLQQASYDPLRRLSDSTVQDVLAARRGYLCIEDTPNIACLRPTDGRRQCTWIDLRNYGVDVPLTTEPGSISARFIASFLMRYTSALYHYNLGSLKPTTGAQALGGFRAGYLRSAIYAHTDKIALDGERLAYYGGRCECFRIGVVPSPVYHADFRSAYGAVQRDCAVPVRLNGRVANPDSSEAERYCASYGVIASVDVETDEEAYPYRRTIKASGIGARNADVTDACSFNADTDIIYPIGRYTTTLCGPELQDALERGRIKRWHWLQYYDLEPALRDYANAIYEMRCTAEGAGDSDIATVAKRLLVSLPGKFGQRDRRWIYCPEMSTDQSYGEWYGSNQRGEPCRYRAIAGKVQRDEMLGWSDNAVPSVAAWITSAARIKLLAAIRIAGWAHTYYTDTDSVMVDESGLMKLESAGLIRQHTMGFLEIKGPPAITEIYGVKHYVESGRLTCAGLPKGQCEDYGDGKHYWYHQTAAEQARSGKRPEATRVLRVYDRGGKYRHRVVGEDGRTTPIVLSEW